MGNISLSFVHGAGHLNHNERKFSRSNVDPERSKNNVYWKQHPEAKDGTEEVRLAYRDLFGEAVEEYNGHQKRGDRKKTIDGYLEEIELRQSNKNGEKPFYEVIVMIGDKDTTGIKEHPEEAEKAKAVLLQYQQEWASRNPNLHAFSVSLHLDEATPHLHIDYIPTADGYKSGLKRRNSLSKALEQQGLENAGKQKDNCRILWQRREREYLSKLAAVQGLTIERVGVDRAHLSVTEYKREREKIDRAAQEIGPVQTKKNWFGRHTITKAELARMDAQLATSAKAEKAAELAMDAADQATAQVRGEYTARARSLDKREQELNGRELTLDDRQASLDHQRELLEEAQAEAMRQMDENLRQSQENMRRQNELENLINTQRHLNELYEREKKDHEKAKKALQKKEDERKTLENELAAEKAARSKDAKAAELAMEGAVDTVRKDLELAQALQQKKAVAERKVLESQISDLRARLGKEREAGRGDAVCYFRGEYDKIPEDKPISDEMKNAIRERAAFLRDMGKSSGELSMRARMLKKDDEIDAKDKEIAAKGKEIDTLRKELQAAKDGLQAAIDGKNKAISARDDYKKKFIKLDKQLHPQKYRQLDHDRGF